MDTLLQNNLPQIRELFLQYGVEAAYAFGSAVKGTRKADSDVDFVIRFPEKMDFVTYSDNYFSLLYALQSLLKTEVDLVTEKTLKNPYLIQSINANKLTLL
ncbi:MAG: nucleotidyltransferase domain-containing protein [Chitinophagaceae bacterium]|nr:nucleotidyltransferase domain-containing protein [Chitinophagaceae bacterium]